MLSKNRLTHQVSKETNIRTENVNFAGDQASWKLGIMSEPDSTFSQTDMVDADLGHFLSRPIKLSSWAWSVGNSLTFAFDPWSQFFSNKRIINRISNYYLLRCNLHVKVVMTGSNFHYGRALIHYKPLAKFDQFSDIGAPQFFSANLVEYTQRPSLFLDPCGSSGGTMVLPYVHPASNLSIPAGEWQTMGDLAVSSITNLKHANGAADLVEISIFAWAEDVHLSIPTSTQPFGLVPQMGMLDAWKNDEYNGMISGPAAIVEHVAGRLKNAPVIGPYAMATQTIASTAGSIARFFGFSRPTMPENAMMTYNAGFGNLTNTNVHDHAVKLALDAKQETTIDSRVMGLGGEDEMTIKSIVTRESYLTRFVWPISAANESILWSSHVTPNLFAVDSGGSGVPPAFHLTPICFGSLPFHYWRGTIKFRFMVVASPYHKGKIVIRYDPRAFVSSEYNINYSHILDIEKDMDFTVEVGWAQGLNYLQVLPMTDGSQINYGTTRRTFLPETNGVLEVSVHNGLTSPSSTVNNDVTVAVFVSAGDDYEVCGPDETTISKISYFPQMGEEELNADADIGDPEESHITYKIASVGHSPYMLAIHSGDPVVSFRQCLKRYQLATIWSQGATSNDWTLWDLVTSDFPLYRGKAPGAIDTVTFGTPPVTIQNNYFNTTLLNYLTPAYVCRRGGIRRLYVLPTAPNPTWSGLTTVTRYMRQIAQSFVTIPLPTNVTNEFDLRRRLLGIFPIMWNGTHLVNPDQNNSINVELPYHNNRRFSPAKRADFTTPSLGLTSHRLTTVVRCDAQSRSAIFDYVSVAEDFQLAFFTGCPKVWFYPNPQ